MLLSINWLKDYIAADIPVDELSKRLTMSGIEVDEVIEIGPQWNNIYVGEILEISPHPNADKLSMTKVKSGEDTFCVVCGAPNIRTGQKIALALEGTLLTNGMHVKRSKIRGELSEGMICSETELAIGSDSSGIMVLPSAAETGKPICESLGLSDTVLSLGITPNRSDCFSVIGMAREISAIFNVPMNIPDVAVSEKGSPTGNSVSVVIQDPDLCPRYAARFISDVKIKQSPLWMRRRLENSGLRSINNIVDITNYVLLEWGQPLHAFDFEMICGNKIIVKRARKGDNFITLDETERQLNQDVLMICDSERPVAIGGVMGGLNSGVTSATTNVLLESAYFTPESISRTSSFLKLKTEASERFAKGVDINSVIPALLRAAALMVQICEGKIAEGFLDKYPNPLLKSKPIRLCISKTCKTLGIKLKSEEIKCILERLQIETNNENPDTLLALPPSFRYDIHEPIDLIEEVARINGYEHIPVTFPSVVLSAKPENKSLRLCSLIRNIFISRGFNEVINYSFISPDQLQDLNFSKDDPRSNPIYLLNPLSSEQAVLRTTILPSLFVNLKDNQNNNINTLKIFEISNVFYSKAVKGTQPVESKRVSGLVSGLRFGEIWNQQKIDVDFYDIKGCVETLLEGFHITSYQFNNDVKEPYFHPQKMLSLFIDEKYAGSIGEVHPDVLENFDIESNACIFDLDFNLLASYYIEDFKFRPFSRHPPIYRDLALIVDEKISGDKIYECISSFNNKLISEYRVFDSYQGKNIPFGKKSLAYRIKFQSIERTLTDKEVNKIHDRLLAYLFKEVGAELR